MSQIIRLSDERSRRGRVFFNRHELNQLLALYSSRVIAGEWRDYAIDMADGAAVFSIYRHSSEGPIYTIVKRPASERELGCYQVASGQRQLSRAHTLDDALRVIEHRLRLVP